MTLLQTAIAEKRRILRHEYGGMMTLQDLTQELGFASTNSARKWVQDVALDHTRIGSRIRYDTDLVAKILVQRREPA